MTRALAGRAELGDGGFGGTVQAGEGAGGAHRGGGGSPSPRPPDASHGASGGCRTCATYHLHLAEDLSEELLSGLFTELRRLQPERDGAVLVGAARDPEELSGILARLSMLGFTVLEVRRVAVSDDRSRQGPSPGPAVSPPTWLP
jgi:hypothetical protein